MHAGILWQEVSLVTQSKLSQQIAYGSAGFIHTYCVQQPGHGGINTYVMYVTQVRWLVYWPICSVSMFYVYMFYVYVYVLCICSMSIGPYVLKGLPVQ